MLQLALEKFEQRERIGGATGESCDDLAAGKRPDLDLSADVRDGAMSVLIGIAARKSIDEGRAIRIEDLTSLVPA